MATTPASSNPDTLVLNMSEDAYGGDAQFTVTVDGVSLGPAQTVTASHAARAQQSFTFGGTWGAGPHKVAVKFVNDFYGGTSATDRNVYLMSATYDGTVYADLNDGLYSSGETAQVTVQSGLATPTSASPPVLASSSTPASVSAPSARRGATTSAAAARRLPASPASGPSSRRTTPATPT